MAENGTNDLKQQGESLSADEQKIAHLLGSLKRVEAPKDFDLRLKAKIANAAPVTRPSWRLIPVLKYALPSILIMAVAGMFLIRDTSVPVDVSTVADQPKPVETVPVPAANPVQPPVVVDQSTTLASVDTPERTELPSSRRIVRPATQPRISTERAVIATAPTPRMSEDKALTGSNVIITPPNLNTKGTQEKPDDFDTSAAIGIRQVLSALDIDANFDGAAWKVRSVKKGGFGERSDVRAGDAIIEIDGRKIEENTSYKGSVSAKTIKIRRGEKIVDIELKYR